MRIVTCSTLLYIFIFSSLAHAIDTVNYSWYRAGRIQLKYDTYYVELLKLALDKSVDKYGEYQLNKVDAGASQQHMIELTRRQHLINLIWTMTSKEREEKLLPIRVPLFKGLGGCRIFLIKKGQQYLFDQLENKEALKSLVAGQGENWPDTEILKSNGFNVLTADEHQTLYLMLAKSRFDYFPRAIHEAINEQAQYPELTMEKRFVIYYDSPFFFFVNKENKRIAKRLEYGLLEAIKDGSFERFFEQYPISAGVIDRANLKEREVITLENPLLTEATKAALKKLGHQASCSH